MSKLSSTLCSSPSFRCTTDMLVCLEWRGEALVGWLTLFLLLDDLFKVHKLKPNVKWRQAFEIYLKTMPPYYLMVTQHSSIGFPPVSLLQIGSVCSRLAAAVSPPL